ncbi:MAG: MFS transporter, partial [Firmicutes bacterium]|nr:MFS transporter [Bacillota bacterium]
IGIFTLIWGLSNVSNGMYGIISLITGIFVLVLFGIIELRSEFPLLDVRALKSNRVLIFSSLAAYINYSSTFAISYMMSMYLQYIKGIEPQYTGMILLIQPAMQAIFSPIAGVLSDKMDPQYVASAGMALITISLFLLSLLGINTQIYLMIMLLGVLGVGFALFSSPNTNSVMSSIERKDYGVAAGILSTARTVGQSFSMAMTALITSFYLGNQTITAETSGLFIQSFKTIFIIFAILCLFGIWASLARGKRAEKDQPTAGTP